MYRIKKLKYKQKKFKEEYAYITDDKYVYLYRGEVSSSDDTNAPGIWIANGIVILKRPKGSDKDIYNKKNIIELTPDIIFKDLDNANLYDADTDSDVWGNDDIFKPKINKTDDIALIGMKYAIGKKHINFNAYSHKFQDAATKNNGRRLFHCGKSLKMDMANRFGKAFDIGFGLVFFDKKGCPNPMDKKYNTAYVIFDSEEVDLKSMNIVPIVNESEDSRVVLDDDIDI